MCRNCGHDCHCGSACKQTHKDGDGKDITIECCKNVIANIVKLKRHRRIMDKEQVNKFEQAGEILLMHLFRVKD